MKQVILSGEILELARNLIVETIEYLENKNDELDKELSLEKNSSKWWSLMALMEVNGNKITKFRELLNHL